MKKLFKLVEKTNGPWFGEIIRCQEMTQKEVNEINSKIQVMKWEPCDEEEVKSMNIKDDGHETIC